MGIKRKLREAASQLASRPTRSQRKKGALATKAEAAAQAAAAGKRLNRPWGKGYGAEMLKSVPQGLAATLRRPATASTRGRPSWLKATPGAAMSKPYPQGLAATLRRKPTASTRGRPSWLKATPQGLSPRKRSR